MRKEEKSGKLFSTTFLMVYLYTSVPIEAVYEMIYFNALDYLNFLLQRFLSILTHANQD